MMLLDHTHFTLFITATLILTFMPGSDVLYIGSQSLLSRSQGIFTVLGTSTGVLIWIMLTVVGLANVLNQSEALFNIVKIIGAAYLFYLAVRAFFAKDSDLHVAKAKRCSNFQSYRKGILINLSNPKVGLFFVTFLPQFINQNHGRIWLQLFLLGMFFISFGTTANMMYVFLFAYLKDKLFKRRLFRIMINKLTGVLFGFLAIKTIMAQRI